MDNTQWYSPIDIKVKDVIDKLISLDRAKSAKEIARESGLDSNVFAQLNAKRSHSKPEWLHALIHTYKINPGYFFYENVNLFADETTNNFEANDNALQVNQNKGNVGNIIHTVNGDIKGSIAKAEKILNDLPPECRKTKCDRMFRDMKKEITYLKKKFEEKETQLLTALKELKAINREAHDVKNKYIGLNDKHMELSEKYTKLLESKSK